ncbi:MAG: hypothetical protein IKV59_07530 [Lachnospiraceae bacterium]|nr:hypothetical protein [Lachnospiraceae bacterium]
MKKMKLMIVLAMVLTVLLGMNVSAKESVSASIGVVEKENVSAMLGNQSILVHIDDVKLSVAEEVKEELTKDVVSTLAGAEYDSTIFCDIVLLDATAGNNVSESVSFPDGVVLTLKAPVRSNSMVKVLHYSTTGGWDSTPEVVAVRDGEIDVKFYALSPIAILVSEGQAAPAPAPGNTSSSSDHDDDDDDDAVEDSRPWESPVTAGGTQSVKLGNVNAGVQIGPTTKTFYESDAKILFGTDKPCSVYLMDLWLFDQNTKEHVLLKKESGQTARITLNVPNVNPNCRVVVRHWLNGTDEYEDIIPVEIGNGYIVTDFTSLSPIAIIVEQVEATPGAAPATTAAATSGKVSPKTAEGSMIYVVELLAAVSLLGLVVYRRRMGK